MELPRFVALKSKYNNKYLRYVREDGTARRGLLQFSGEEIVSPYVKFEVEKAKCGEELVHLRCCCNNKYWARWKEEDYWISATTNKPEENKSKWSCTLFKPEFVDGDVKTVRFVHVQLEHYACCWAVAAPYENCFYAAPLKDIKRNVDDVFTVIDWETLLIMPKYVAFKGDNGKYLGAHGQGGHHYNKFWVDDKGAPQAGYEIFTTPEGSARVKSIYYGRFWRLSPGWIWADTDETTSNNPDTLFWPIKVQDNVIALRCLGNNNFCKRLTTDFKEDCLNACIPTISREARMQVEELVISREIYNIEFHLSDARIYNERPLSMENVDSSNDTEEPSNIELQHKYTDHRSESWNSSVSFKMGVSITLKAGIPCITEDGIVVSLEETSAKEWGKTESKAEEAASVFKATVPKRTKVKARLIATQGSCDVPFSYTQRDVLINGEQVIQKMDDGIFNGVNCYNFKYETKQEPL